MTIQFIASAGFWKHRVCLWRWAALKYYRLSKQAQCGWCGCVGPREKVAEHILECVNHPMSELARQWLAEKKRDEGKIAELTEALQFYADESNHENDTVDIGVGDMSIPLSSRVDSDGGRIARAVLSTLMTQAEPE